MKYRKLRVGIIGCGAIAFSKHMPALAAFPDEVEMTAFCNRTLSRAVEARDRFGTPDAQVFTDYRDLLACDLDAVHICTANRSHAEIAIAAMRAGKHVLCEKPMAASEADARAMLEAHRETGRLLVISYQERFRADVQALKKLTAAGELGEIYMAKAHALRRRGIPTWGVFTNLEAQGGGPVIDIATHALDLTLWLMDNYEPVTVLGATYNHLGTGLRGDAQGTPNRWNPDTYEVEDAGFGLVRFANGSSVFIESSWALNTTDEREAMTTLYGTKAGAEMDYLTDRNHPGHRLRLNRITAGLPAVEELIDRGTPSAPGAPDPEAVAECADWLEALRGEHPPTVLPEQAYTVTRILEALYTSSRTGQAVTLG